jgi:hypothetical protein
VSLADLREAFCILDANAERGDFVGPMGAGTIGAAERALGIRFPESYRRFLSKYGAGDIAGEEIFGLLGDDFVNSGIPDAVWLTLGERKRSGLPADLVLINAIGTGEYYAIRCSQAAGEGESPVVLWSAGDESGAELPIMFADFGQFLKEILEEAI